MLGKDRLTIRWPARVSNERIIEMIQVNKITEDGNGTGLEKSIKTSFDNIL